MAGAKGKFTDNQLTLLFGHLLTHYKVCINQQEPMLNVQDVYTELFKATQYALESPKGSLSNLDKEEKEKVYMYFEAIFRSTPLFTSMPVVHQYSFIPKRTKFDPSSSFQEKEYTKYTTELSSDRTWQIFSDIAYHCHQLALDVKGKQPKSNNDQEDSDMNSSWWITLITILGIAALGAVLTFASLYYMFNHFINGMDRMWYGEGWIKAALMMSTSLGFGGALAGLMIAFATPILTGLAISAGLNPFIVVVVTTVCVSVVGAGLASLGMSLLYDLIEKLTHQSSIDPYDPYRFRITQEEENRLLEKHIDPVKAKCAIIALRSEIAKQLESEDEVPSFLSRQFGDGKKVQMILNQVRDLRSGNLSVIQVGDLTFDCRMPVVTQFNSTYQHFKPIPYSTNTHSNVVVEARDKTLVV